jgi:hypothetical protein
MIWCGGAALLLFRGLVVALVIALVVVLVLVIVLIIVLFVVLEGVIDDGIVVFFLFCKLN